MKFAIVGIFAIAAVSGVVAELSEEFLLSEFSSYADKFGKNYTDDEEIVHRFNIFSSNYKRIVEMNLKLNNGDKNGTKKAYGLTKFTDMTRKEKRDYTNYRPRISKIKGPVAAVPHCTAAPSSYDWRQRGYVSDIVDQGQCGSCWAFSAAFGVESAWAMANGGISPDFHLSPQQLVDCDPNSYGCSGGDLPPAFDYLVDNGMAKWNDYPYTARDGKCKMNSSIKTVDVTGYEWVIPNCSEDIDCDQQDEELMVRQIAVRGPAAVCVAVPDAWFDYTGPEPFTDACDHGYYDLNHCVGLVGWVKSNDPESQMDGYWILRNSWGKSWGIDGYMHVPSSFKKFSKYNNYCGIASEAAFATIKV